MSLLFLARKWALGVVLAVPLAVSAQNGFAPLGGEYAPVGSLPGEQAVPCVSVQTGGGYLVWQDQNTFGNRLTVMARVLSSAFKPSYAPFRVNSGNVGDHENAKVALLNNGGAVFVWQGGQMGFQHIYARFLSSSNTWIGLDQMVNAASKIYQAKPSVAVLNNGNVIVVYETYNPVTMRDVSGQLFSPTGVKIGGEFQINQFTSFNQRSASVAALTNGGFVVTWVSEQQARQAGVNSGLLSPSQFQLASVDIYARLFDPNANAASDEFIVNNSSNVAGNPVVATAGDGSLLFVYGERDAAVMNNGWDIFARPFTFSASGVPYGGTELRVNTQLYGDQFAPHVAFSGTQYLVIWTSQGQDGSREGIFGQYLNLDGSRSGGEFRVNTTTLGSQMQPTIAADNNARFLTAWAGPTFGPKKNDIFGQVYAGPNYVPSVVGPNYLAPVFVPDNGSQPPATGLPGIIGTHNPSGELPVLNYPGQIALGSSSTPAANAFAQAAGSYHGLFYDANGANPSSSGYFTANTTAGKSFTANIYLDGIKYSFAGTLNASGVSQPKSIPRSNGQSALTVTLQEDLFGADQIKGQIAARGGWTATLVADRQVFKPTTNPTPLAGQYTLAVPGNGTGIKTPGGAGVGTIAVDPAGNLTWVATLADGTKASQVSAISKSGVWPLYAYLGAGSCALGWISITNLPPSGTTNQAVNGDFLWFKHSAIGGKFYPAGFTNDVPVMGSVYVPPPAGGHDLTLSGADLTASLIYPFEVGNSFSTINLGTNKLSLLINGATGVFTGTCANPAQPGKTVGFQGVLLDGASGTGFFLESGQSGQVTLDQTHAP